MQEREYFHMYHQEQNHWWYVGMRDIARSLLPPGSLPAGALALDAGCGTGFFMAWLRQNYGVRVAGVDLYPQALLWCRKGGERTIAQGDAAALPVRTGSIDLVSSMDVLSHVADEDSRRRALAEFHRVLKPGGLLLLRVAAYEWLRTSHDDEILTSRRHSGAELLEAVAGARFDILRWTFANTLLFPAAVAWRLLKRAGIAPQGSDVREFTRGRPWVNRSLLWFLESEAAILRKPRARFPFGLSIIVLARRPAR